jgi:hypothetical protein
MGWFCPLEEGSSRASSLLKMASLLSPPQGYHIVFLDDPYVLSGRHVVVRTFWICSSQTPVSGFFIQFRGFATGSAAVCLIQ